MKNDVMLRTLVAVVLSAGISSCDKVGEQVTGAVEEVCGPCPDIADGELLVTGAAQIDGMFKALNIFGSANARISGSYEGQITAIGEAFGVVRGDDMSIGDYTDAVLASVTAELDASVAGGISGGLRIDYVPPACSANVNVAVSASADCQADCGCEPPTFTPGMVSVVCDGQCSGGCSGTCEGSCAVEVTGGKCTGSCEGGCALEVAATCNGTCNGTCDGTCEVRDSEGACKGQCDGDCTGTCEMAVAAECSGSCSGTCSPPEVMPDCTGECSGSCGGECSGGCAGSATPPMVEGGSCDCEADCNASASAQASASLECTPPRLEIDYTFSAALKADASLQATFLAKFTVLKTELVGIVQGFANARLLVEGDADLDIPPIQDVISGQIEAMAEIDAEALGNITPYGAVCAAASLVDAAAEIASAAGELGGTLQAQTSFVAAFSI